MRHFLTLKIRLFALVMVLVTFFTTLLAGLIPGSPAFAIYGVVPISFANAWNRSHGLDNSIWVQYWHWVYQAFHGNLGTSWESDEAVRSLLAQRIPVTAELAVGAMVVSLLVAIPVAMAAAYRPNGIVDRIVTTLTSLLAATPPFVSGIFLVAVLAVRLRWLPSQSWVSIGSDPGQNLVHAVLPVATLVLGITPLFLRVLRGDLVSILNEDFVVAARSRGLSEIYVMTRHVLRPASASLMTVAGIAFGSLLGGAVIVEIFYGLPGIGFLVDNSINYKDLPVLQGVVVCAALLFVLINTCVDLLYGVLDPRVRIG